MGDFEIDSRLNIREMRETDLQSMCEIEKKAHLRPWSMNIFLDCYHSDYLCFVATKGKTVCGYIILSRVVDESHLLNLCVSVDQQGLGVGRSLACEGILQVSRVGAKKMFLEVRRSNVCAIGLYRSLGFVEIGVRADYYTDTPLNEDALIFALDIEK